MSTARDRLRGAAREPTTWALLAYAAVMALLAPRYADTIDADMIGYMAAAREYAGGHLYDGVSGHWSPLLSWLQVPFLLAGADPLVAAHLAGALLGAVAVLGAGMLARTCLERRLDRALLQLVVVPLAIFGSTYMTSPDIGVGGVLSLYLAVALRREASTSRRLMVLAGVLGAAAYFTKGVAFFCFLGHFALMGGASLLRASTGEERRRAVRTAIVGLAAFAAVAGPWATLVSTKYGRPTPNTASLYVMRLLQPESPGEVPHSIGLAPPPHARGQTYWEDPTPFCTTEWRPWSSGAALHRQAWKAVSNLRLIATSWTGFSLLGLPIVLLAAGLLLIRPRRALDDLPLLGMTLALGLHTALYGGLFVIERYLWMQIPWLALIGLLLARRLAASRGGWVGHGAALLVAASFLPYPVGRVLDQDRPGTWDHMIVTQGRNLRRIARQLSELGVEGPIASNGRWHRTLFTAWFLDAPYYGERGPFETDEHLAQIREHRITCYAAWEGSPPAPPEVLACPELLYDAADRVRFYDLRPLLKR